MTIPIIDFHAHFFHPDLPALAPVGVSGASVFGTPEFVKATTDIATLIAQSDRNGIAVRVLNAPPSTFSASGAPGIAAIRKTNDWIAENVRRHPSRLAGLASIDIFAGDEAAREVDRAIGDLGLDGIVIDSAQGPDLYAGEARTLPALERAATHGVPVFLHPVSGAFISSLGSLDRSRVFLDRGLANAAGLINLIEKNVFAQFPGLTVIATALGASALLTLSQIGLDDILRPEGTGRRPVYFDVMGFRPSLIRFLAERLGSDRLLVGTDTPIATPVTGPEIVAALAVAGLNEQQRIGVANANARRLLRGRTRFDLSAAA